VLLSKRTRSSSQIAYLCHVYLTFKKKKLYVYNSHIIFLFVFILKMNAVREARGFLFSPTSAITFFSPCILVGSIFIPGQAITQKDTFSKRRGVHMLRTSRRGLILSGENSVIYSVRRGAERSFLPKGLNLPRSRTGHYATLRTTPRGRKTRRDALRRNAAVRRRCTRPASIIYPRSDVIAGRTGHWRMRHPMVKGRYDTGARAPAALKLARFAPNEAINFI